MHAKPMLSKQCLIDWSQAMYDWPTVHRLLFFHFNDCLAGHILISARLLSHKPNAPAEVLPNHP